ncbi:transposase [Cohnella thailandensis]|uniref:IS1595 family transposase n=1 Tax=Cohnella thailandensis TaxID=557557 RepID=A0A841T255_9BACL|nr:transposase [Cohnella thailandensis]MBB6635161.1 IS1595 family transposase [Cohnella thailandensis]MBP1974373.1 transposase-like protein [Cohnella thailandensis]
MDQSTAIADEFNQQFPNEQACAAALYQARWPKGFRCPACGSPRFYILKSRRRPLFECASPRCRRQTSVTAGTIMEGSRTPLSKWFLAFRLLSQSGGISSVRLSRLLDVTYKTAWLISHKIRIAMQQEEESEQLQGFVRIEPFHYGLVYYMDALQPLVLGAAMDSQGNPSRVLMHQPHPSEVNDKSRKINPDGIQSFVRSRVSEHAAVVHRSQESRTPKPLMTLKYAVGYWLNSTFHGIGAKHLQAYLNEFCFRQNASYRGHGSPFGLLLNWCATTRRQTYRTITRPRPVLTVPWITQGLTRNQWRGKHLTLLCS